MSRSVEELLDQIEEYENVIHDLKQDLTAEIARRRELESDDFKTFEDLNKQIEKLELEIEKMDEKAEQKEEQIKQTDILFQSEKKEREQLEDELIKALALLETLNQGNVKFFSTTEGLDALSTAKRMMTQLVTKRTAANK